jgi:hypothetical protein
MTQDAIAKLLVEHLIWRDDDGDPWCTECSTCFESEREWADHIASLIALGFAI